MYTQKHLGLPRTENRETFESAQEVEILNITASGTAQQIVFTKYVKWIVLFNVGPTNNINLFDAVAGTLPFTIVLSAAPLTLAISGKALPLWVKAVAGSPVLQCIGLR